MKEFQQVIRQRDECSPLAHKSSARHGSCMAKDHMLEIIRLYNKDNPNDQITNIKKTSNSTLRNILKQKMGCSSEKCVVESSLVRKSSELYAKLSKLYRPTMPRSWHQNMNEWLSNYDIENVMLQYHDEYKDFHFLGVFPIDAFDKNVCNIYNVCSFNFFDFISSGKTKLGLVFNLDRHTGRGYHWVSIFASFNPKSKQFGLCYYDSTGNDAPSHAKQFCKQLREDANLFFRDVADPMTFQTKRNLRQHQYKNTECGVFSMLFLIMCLENSVKDYRSIVNMLNNGADDVAMQHRQLLFTKD